VFDPLFEQNATIRHPRCFWRDTPPVFSLTRASVWWSTLDAAWHTVAAWETRAAIRFDNLVITRPDIYWQRPMGPWCAYDLSALWYLPASMIAPDMFWVRPRLTTRVPSDPCGCLCADCAWLVRAQVLPREWARRVLTTWSKVVVPCAPGEACCQLQSWDQPRRSNGSQIDAAINTHGSNGSQIAKFSVWMHQYWQQHGGMVQNTTLMGHGLVGAHRAKKHRDCTIHVGCLPNHGWSMPHG
jgi:hypothetical protein